MLTVMVSYVPVGCQFWHNGKLYTVRARYRAHVLARTGLTFTEIPCTVRVQWVRG